MVALATHQEHNWLQVLASIQTRSLTAPNLKYLFDAFSKTHEHRDEESVPNM